MQQSIAYRYSYGLNPFPTTQANVKKIIAGREQRKKQQLQEGQLATKIRSRFDFSEDQIKAKLEHSLNTIQSPATTGTVGGASDQLKVELPSIGKGRDELEASTVGQSFALKKKDLEKFNQIRKKEIVYDDNDLLKEIGEESENFDDLSSVDLEISSQLAEIQNDINATNSGKAKHERAMEVFENMRQFCRQQLQYGSQDVSYRISRLLDDSASEVSPLLKFYNELAEYGNFKMCPRSLLEFDLRIFRKHLSKIQLAHEVELRWVKKAAIDKAKDLMKEKFQSVREEFLEEISSLLRQHEELKTKYEEAAKELDKARDLTRQQGVLLAELNEMLKMQEINWEEGDNELGEANEGPKEDGGPVNDKINLLHTKFMMVGVYEKAYKVEKLLKKPFQFFSTYLSLSTTEKGAILEDEVVSYYKVLLLEKEEELFVKRQENDGLEFVIKQYQQQEVDLNKKIDHLNNEIDRNFQLHQKELKRQGESYTEIIDGLKREKNVIDTEFHQCKDLYKVETEVLEHVIFKQKDLIRALEYKTRDLATILKIPREHQKYIEKNGVHQLILECMKILETNQKKEIEKNRNEVRIKNRHEQSIQKFVKNMQGSFKQDWKTIIEEPVYERSPLLKALEPKELLQRKLELGGKQSLTTMNSPSNISFVPGGNKGLPLNYSSLMDLDRNSN